MQQGLSSRPAECWLSAVVSFTVLTDLVPGEPVQNCICEASVPLACLGWGLPLNPHVLRWPVRN